MIKLGTVTEVFKLRRETTRIEVLIDAGCIEPAVSDATGHIHVYILPPKMVGAVIQDSFELLLPQFGERIYGISDVSGSNSRFRRCHQPYFAQAGIAAPVSSQLMHSRRIDSG